MVWLAVPLLVAVPAACTFLVSFDDDGPEDAGISFDASPPEDVSATDDTGPGPDVPDASSPFCPGYVADPAATPCSINADRPATAYCGCDRLRNYQGSPDDLVTCGSDGGILAVEPCAFGCALYPPGTSSACDGCQGREDGRYCASDFGVDAGKAIMECRGGRQVESAIDCPGATRCLGLGPDAGCGS